MVDEEISELKYEINDEDALYRAYMPFLKNGGLFIRTKETYPLGRTVLLTVQLMKTELKVRGQVVWITPVGAEGNKPAGVGIHFSDEDKDNFRNKIESFLAGKVQSSQLNDTI